MYHQAVQLHHLSSVSQISYQYMLKTQQCKYFWIKGWIIGHQELKHVLNSRLQKILIWINLWSNFISNLIHISLKFLQRKFRPANNGVKLKLETRFNSREPSKYPKQHHLKRNIRLSIITDHVCKNQTKKNQDLTNTN